MSVELRHSSASHAGAVRRENQDALLCRPEIGLFLVADGAGGHRDGAIAAARVVSSAAALETDATAAARLTALRQRLSHLHDSLLDEMEAREDGSGTASTVVALLLDRHFFACLWAGDSRIYLLRDGALIRLTHDHSVVQELIDSGSLDAREAESHREAHVITRAVGAGTAQLMLDKRVGQVMPYDRFLLCSDGLTRALDEPLIRRCLEQGGNAAGTLVDAALRRKARDNVTAVVVTTD
ncbi:serine/threonine-protein phosphatase [Acidisoma cellulosilytica]|uniref:Serine/threonine-protein phosphatase n=1 Tax=Acidisoma cellulosilyticum TaxID=2802395 RepID=A0A963Z349_9PROT|nr:PP2C family serine/threonine-protein phosphatase [Acidisoma cellulosilyticum]MCB8881030.1 serine/threonine-protein phosphatase [Acidisoma cellulosilyticum]